MHSNATKYLKKKTLYWIHTRSWGLKHFFVTLSPLNLLEFDHLTASAAAFEAEVCNIKPLNIQHIR